MGASSEHTDYTGFNKGDVLEFKLKNKMHLGIYIDNGGVVYSETDEIPPSLSFLKKFVYKLFPQVVKIKRIEDLRPTLKKKASKRDQLKIVRRSIIEVGSRTHRNDIKFVEYCLHGTKITFWLTPISIAVASFPLWWTSVPTKWKEILQGNSVAVSTAVYGYFIYSIVLPFAGFLWYGLY
jgi:hypothetical protein